MKPYTFYGSVLTLMLVISANARAGVDWQPSFDDKPLSSKDQEQILAAVPATPIVEPNGNRKILVYSATAGFRHRSIPHGKFALEQLGEKSGAFEVVVSDDPANLEPEALERFDAVVLLNTTLDFFMPPAKGIEKRFSAGEIEALQERHDRAIDNLIG